MSPINQTIVALVSVIALGLYGAQYWNIFRRWLTLCLPASLIATAITAKIFAAPFWFTVIFAGGFLGLASSAFLTYIHNAQNQGDKS
ncbi:MAG: hypothetical protein K2W82_18290 [Candidatus Obscuribacterales bacterium]|nr:hypothetical protein [Candidatus Obscuribacterales bacterium]